MSTPFVLAEGYRPGLIARITEMHVQYYTPKWHFGQRFESVVASGLAHFCDRLHHASNALWTLEQAGVVMGSVAIDGEDLGPGIAHLRWFILDERARALGHGRWLLSQAIDFADAQGFSEVHLWTFNGLDAARHLYESHGFACTQEQPGAQWGTQVLEQKFVRKKLAPSGN